MMGPPPAIRSLGVALRGAMSLGAALLVAMPLGALAGAGCGARYENLRDVREAVVVARGVGTQASVTITAGPSLEVRYVATPPVEIAHVERRRGASARAPEAQVVSRTVVPDERPMGACRVILAADPPGWPEAAYAGETDAEGRFSVPLRALAQAWLLRESVGRLTVRLGEGRDEEPWTFALQAPRALWLELCEAYPQDAPAFPSPLPLEPAAAFWTALHHRSHALDPVAVTAAARQLRALGLEEPAFEEAELDVLLGVTTTARTSDGAQVEWPREPVHPPREAPRVTTAIEGATLRVSITSQDDVWSWPYAARVEAPGLRGRWLLLGALPPRGMLTRTLPLRGPGAPIVTVHVPHAERTFAPIPGPPDRRPGGD